MVACQPAKWKQLGNASHCQPRWLSKFQMYAARIKRKLIAGRNAPAFRIDNRAPINPRVRLFLSTFYENQRFDCAVHRALRKFRAAENAS